ncbi:sulfite reductase subunit C [Diplocloster agilis]|uniref:Sulfite reductase subunit C n=1 Tax=Diplocloster agilis TaxID=2850323 RepID=A0A949JYD2_9FIRM|nr:MULTISPECIES: sulfite reductase subunit C [Lachnospiraceae]MBU9736421.1 sulfite reductase subunit C [Diplocloster agilis]MBU9744921.1 sulfite reductase subunit C [Diplocloster agilis]MCU6735862.1 sulfite reductase subunit C [Suonthocola fibrivorans]SCJ83309.1 ferredoxin-nitrite reductase [uncultured Clostridium sp.]
MNHDIDIKKTRINCFRQSKVPGEFMLQMRVPGAVIDAKYLKVVMEIAEKWGNGTFHLGTRQTLNAPGIKYENIPAVNAYIKDYIHDVDQEMCGCDMEADETGYPTIGARNVMACIGNSHCIKGNCNSTELARKIEKLVFPSHYHIKVAVAGCPNDCVKANFNDFGIMGIYKMDYNYDRCIGCGACVDACEHHATGVLSLNKDNKVDKDTCCCVGCAECVLACPTSAWTRNPKKLYRVTLGGRTGKQNPRAGKLFLNWVTEDVLLGMFANWQKFSAWALDYKPEYLHGGHLIDRAGYKTFVKHIFEGVEFNPEAKMADDIYWAENEQRANIHVMPLSKHKTAGPQE